MKHTVRRIVSIDHKETVGFGVFMAWNVHAISEQGAISINYCTDPDDDRPLKDQWGKTYKMEGLHKTIEAAKSRALQLNAQRIVRND